MELPTQNSEEPEIRTLQRAGFFQKAYDQTLRPVFGDKVDPEQVLP